jgi:hypothetical protein
MLSIGEEELDAIRQARAHARERAWRAGASRERVILDLDATPITSHTEKEGAAGHYKGGFGSRQAQAKSWLAPAESARARISPSNASSGSCSSASSRQEK